MATKKIKVKKNKPTSNTPKATNQLASVLSQNKKLAYAIATGLVLTGSFLTAKAADKSYPGQPLYWLDRTAETLQSIFMFSHKAKVDFKLRQLEERAEELKQIPSDKKNLIENQIKAIEQLLISINQELKDNWDSLSAQDKLELVKQLKEAAHQVGQAVRLSNTKLEDKKQILEKIREAAQQLARSNFQKRDETQSDFGFMSKKQMDEVKTAPKTELTEDIKQQILYMREEEKLARDVYLALYDKWGERIFKNIAASEQTHMDLVKTLIDKYNLQDPILKTGKFSDKKLQDLYDSLVAKGQKSLADALEVGATIEDLDIYDLNNALSNIKDTRSDVYLTFSRLREGSYRHMQAFYQRLKDQGKEYKAQYISQEELDEILDTEHRGPQNRRPGSRKGRRQMPFAPRTGRGGQNYGPMMEDEDNHDQQGYGPMRQRDMDWQDEEH